MNASTASEGIKFKFSPAYSPHFGGIWEAGVKSAKFHILKILGNQHLTFEELSTLFAQIEALLNSRPLTPLSTDPNDLSPLTPGHFLIGRALTSLPSSALLDINVNHLDRYQKLERIRQHFWERWRHEYLSEIHQRSKWQTKQNSVQEGDMVVLKDPNLPPLQWRVGRVSRLYPGSDGVTRVIDAHTAKGILRRAVAKVCLLPTSSSSFVTSRILDVFEGGKMFTPYRRQSGAEGAAHISVNLTSSAVHGREKKLDITANKTIKRGFTKIRPCTR